MTDRGWGRSFEDPIEADGRKLVTLRDAGEYIAALPKKDHDAPEWQARHGSIDAGCRARWPDDVRPDRHHEGLELRKPVLDLSGDVSRNASSHCLTASQKRIDVTAAQFARSR